MLCNDQRDSANARAALARPEEIVMILNRGQTRMDASNGMFAPEYLYSASQLLSSIITFGLATEYGDRASATHAAGRIHRDGYLG